MRDVTKVLSNRLCRYKSIPNITTELGLKICQISLNEKCQISMRNLALLVLELL